MNETPRSSGEKHIENIMKELDPGSDRYQVLDTARRFKSSWVELGQQLLHVNHDRLYQGWGYENFEDYCAKEIRIKKPTAQKLTQAYRFLEKDEPQLLARQTELKPLPDYRSVDLLRQAREEKAFTDEEYAELRNAVVEEERSHPTVLKRFKEVASSKEPPQDNPLPQIKSGLSAARRLQTTLFDLPGIPEDYPEQLERIISYLEDQVETLKTESEDS